MKFRSIYIVFVFILAVFAYIIYSRAGKTVPDYYFWKVELSTAEDFTKVVIIDTTTIWIIGAAGAIYKSEDSGESWERLRQPDDTKLQDIYFLDANKAWVTGINGIFLSTSDGGKTWKSAVVGAPSDTYNAVWFIDELNGFLAGGVNTQTNQGLIYSTNDGGIQWLKYDIAGMAISDMVFLDNNTGVAITTNELIRTEDAGNTWALNRLEAGLHLRRLFFIDENTGWAAGNNAGLYSTADGGNTWTLSQDGETYKINDIYFLDSCNGWAVGDNGIFIYTLNGGRSWQPMDTGIVDNFYSVHFLDAHFGYICGNNGAVMKVETLK